MAPDTHMNRLVHKLHLICQKKVKMKCKKSSCNNNILFTISMWCAQSFACFSFYAVLAGVCWHDNCNNSAVARKLPAPESGSLCKSQSRGTEDCHLPLTILHLSKTIQASNLVSNHPLFIPVTVHVNTLVIFSFFGPKMLKLTALHLLCFVFCCYCFLICWFQISAFQALRGKVLLFFLSGDVFVSKTFLQNRKPIVALWGRGCGLC